MEFNKKTLSEALNLQGSEKKTFSEKPQSIVVSEEQLERLISKVSKEKK